MFPNSGTINCYKWLKKNEKESHPLLFEILTHASEMLQYLCFFDFVK